MRKPVGNGAEGIQWDCTVVRRERRRRVAKRMRVDARFAGERSRSAVVRCRLAAGGRQGLSRAKPRVANARRHETSEPDDRNLADRGSRDGERIPASPSDFQAPGAHPAVRYSAALWPRNRIPYITTRALTNAYEPIRRAFLRVCFCKLCCYNVLRGQSGSPVFGKSNSANPLGIHDLENGRRDVFVKERAPARP